MRDAGTMRTVAQLGEWTGGATPPKGVALYWGGLIPWVSPKDMNGDVILGSEDRVTELGASRADDSPGGVSQLYFGVAFCATRFRSRVRLCHSR